MDALKVINYRDENPILPVLRLAISFHLAFDVTVIFFLILAGTLFLFDGIISYAADSGVELQQKEADLKKKQAEAEAVRADIRKDHPGDTRPPETVIQSDIAFEDSFQKKLSDAQAALNAFEMILSTAKDSEKTLSNKSSSEIVKLIASGAVKLRDISVGKINAKLNPFFMLDSNGTLLIGPAFFGLPAQFLTVGGMSIDDAQSAIKQMVNDNAAMKQKRQDQLAVLADEIALSAEIDQLKKQQQRKKIVRFWVECSPVEIFPDESSLCSTNVEFENGSFDKYNVRSIWTGAPDGVVRGDSAPPGTTVNITATYQAALEEGGGSWSGSASVRIKARPPKPAPAVAPTPGGTTPGPGQPTVTDQTPGDQDPPGDKTDHQPDKQQIPPPFEAQLECPPSFELLPGDFVGRGCGITVRGWNANGPRVEVKVEVPKKSGIDIFPGDTSADASQMHTAGVTDLHSQYTFSESIRANETAQQGVSTVTITVSQQGVGSVVLTLQVSILRKGEIPSQYGIKPPVTMATGGGKDAKWCVWRYRYPYEPPECFLFAKAECFKYGPPKYELVGQLMTWMQSEALMSRLSRYGGDAYGCLKAGANPPGQQDGGGGSGSGNGGGGGSGNGGGDGSGNDGDKGGADGGGDESGTTDQNACRQNSDCPEGHVCTDGQCVEQQADNRCDQDSDCPTGYACANGQCVEPFDNNFENTNDLLAQREEQRDEDIIDRSFTDQGSGNNQDGYTSKDLDKDLEATQESVSTECNNHKSCPKGKVCENGKCVDKAGSGGSQQGLTISPATKVVKVNEPVTFQAHVTAAGGSGQDVTQQTTWSPGNPFSSGTVGQYTVTATYQGQSGSATVSVVEQKGLDDITVNSKTITVSFFDHGQVDGDMIDILVNNQTVASGITLTKAPQSRTINMTSDIVVFGFRALNEGKIPPNTATVTFTSVVQGKNKQTYELKKNQKSNMNITYRP